MIRRRFFGVAALLYALTASVAMAQDSSPAPARKAQKEELRITTERVARLAAAGNGGKLAKKDRKRVNIAAHLQFAIRQKAKAEGVSVTQREIDSQLRAWNVPAAAGDPSRARNYDEQEQAMALRDVAETRLLFTRLAEKAGSAQKAYETLVTEYVEALPNKSGVNFKEILKAAPAVLGALSGGGGGDASSGDALSSLGQILAPRPAEIAKQLEKTVKEFDGNPDNLPLVLPNSAVTARQ